MSARGARGFPLFGGHGMNFPGMNGMNIDHITTQLMEAHQPAIYATKPDVLAALPRLRVAGRGDAPGQVPEAAEAAAGASGVEAAACSAGDPCTVCHDDIGEGTTVVQLPCKHCFHEECILPWLEVCPTPCMEEVNLCCQVAAPPDPTSYCFHKCGFLSCLVSPQLSVRKLESTWQLPCKQQLVQLASCLG